MTAMVAPLMRVGPSESDDAAEQEFDLAYYASLDTATRFRMTVERSVLLLDLVNRDAKNPGSPALVKRL